MRNPPIDSAAVEFKALGHLVAALKVLPVPPEVFTQRAQSADGAFLLEESLRFFNFGAAPKDPATLGEAFVQKGFPRITPESFEQALTDFCRTHTEFIYNHVENVYNELNPKTLPEFSEKWRNHDWMKAAAADEPLKGVLVPHAMFGNLKGPAIGRDVLQFHKAVSAFQRSASMLGEFHKNIKAIIGMLSPQQRALIAADQWSALDCRDWVGSPHAVTYDTAVGAEFLSEFVGGTAVGLTEKIYATIILCVSTVGFEPSVYVRGDLPLLATRTTRDIESALLAELDKLGGRLGVKKRPTSTLEVWLEGLFHLEDWLHLLFGQADAMPVAAGAAGAPSVIRSDLIWGFVLCAYLRLHLLRALVLALTASVPFRQVYEGGMLWPGQSEREVPGVVGIIAVSLWEYFTGTQTPHPLCEGARSLAPAISGFDEKRQWVDPINPREPPPKLKMMPNPIFSSDPKRRKSPFRPPVSISLDSPYVSEDTRRTYSMVQLPLVSIADGKPGPLQRYGGLNTRRPPVREPKENQEQWRKGLSGALARFQDFPPAGVFGGGPSTNESSDGLPPIPVELNPPILDRFFVLGDDKDRVFNKWGAGSDSNLSYANKLTCQLQMYVAGWLCVRFLEEAQALAPEFANLSRQIKFTQGSIPFGGKFPPHETHRDGYGADWSLYGSSDQYWAWSVHWPRDDKMTERVVDGAKQKVSMATDLMGEAEPLRRRCQLVRQSFAKLLNERGATPATLAAVRRRIHDEIATFVPKKYLDQHTDRDGNYTVAAIPSDVLIARHRDTYSSSRQGPGQPVYIFRDHLKEYVYDDQNLCEKFLRDPMSNHSFDGIDVFLQGVVDKYRDWPIFPDRGSHWAHHVAHLAVLLSMPLEFCWGAPIYHFRAVRAACLGFLDAPEHPFLGLPPSKRAKMDPDDHTRYWPLPLPLLAFMPHDHHHHWHLNYWRTDSAPLPQWIQSRVHKQVVSHLDFVTACLPMWVMLGVDFGAFEKYLVDYAAVVKGSLLNQVTALRILLHEGQRRIEEGLTSEFRNGRADFRKHLAELAIEDFEDPSGVISNWPMPGSQLAQAINDARMIKTGVDRISQRITPKMLPTEILEALDRPSDERDFELQRSDARVPIIAGEALDEREIHMGDSEAKSDNLDERCDPHVVGQQTRESTPEANSNR